MTDRDDYSAAAPLFETLAALADDDTRRQQLRDELVTIHLPVARHIAARFRGRGESIDDLEQVATMGLIKAVDRYDPTRQVAFLGYAVPTMMGEIRRYFRDSAWTVRLPRRLSELYLAINRATRELAQSLGRAPTPRQLAEHLQVSVDEIHEAIEAGHAYRASSLDDTGTGRSHDDRDRPLAQRLGDDDPGMGLVEDRAVLGPALAQLPERERRIVLLRFFEHRTQTQIAELVGISQMHVSRLLARSLRQLRRELASAADDPASQGA